MKYIKQQILHDRKIGDRQFIIKGDGSIELTPDSGTVTINGDLRVTGSSSGATNNLVYYVSMEGDDSNDGLGAGADRAKKTVKAAVEAAPPGATIQLAPGNYYEDNPITMKERQTVRGDSLRNCQIWPLNNTQDIFLMDNACYLFQVTFRGLRDPGWCARIRPGALVTTSPYVQNCTNMNGPWLNDGTEFIPYETVQIEGVEPDARPIINNPDVPLGKRVNETGGGNGILVDGDDYDPRSLVFSFVADAFTQIAQGGIGFHITNFGYTQIVSCFTVFCRTGFLTTNGGYLSISNSVSDFGTFGIIADGLFDRVYTTARPSQDYYSSVGSITVGSQGAGYTSAPVVVIDPPTTPGGVQATATATLDATTGKVTAVTITDSGSGYDFQPNVTFVGGGFSVIADGTVNLVKNRIINVNSLRDQPQVGSVIQFENDPTYYYVTETEVTTQPFIYNEEICRRDVRRIVDAIAGDMALGTNYQAIAAGKSYLRSRAQKVLLQQLEPTVFGINAARDEMLARLPDSDVSNLEARYDIIERFAEVVNIIEQGDSTSAPDIFYNDTNIDSGTVAARENILTNREFIIEEINKYIADQFTNLSYNQDKCERDINLITVGTAFDVALGTNYNAVTAGIAYARTNAERVIDDQLTITLDTFDQLKSYITNLSAVSSSLLATNRATAAIDEIKDIIEGLAYNKTLCRRDVGYLIDASGYDAVLGTNYNAVTAGLAYQRAPSAYVLSNQFQMTIAAIEYLKTQAAEYLSDNATAVSRSNAAFNEVLDILSRSAGEADAITWSDPGVNANKTYARILLQANRSFIATELTDYITASYPLLVYDVATCQRDVEYIVDALSFDVQYNGNFATRKAADAYFSGAVSVLPADQKGPTEAAMQQLAVIVSQIVTESYTGQTTTGNPASGTESTEVDGLVQIIEDVIAADSLDSLPTLVEPTLSWVASGLLDAYNNYVSNKTAIIEDVIEEIDVNITNQDDLVFPSPTGGLTQRTNAKDQLQLNREFIQSEIIAWIGVNYPDLTYDQKRCKRDVGLIVDALCYDILYGGNSATRSVAQSYYVGTIAQLGTDSIEILATSAAYDRLKVVVEYVIQAVALPVSTGNTVVQDRVTYPSGTGVESDKSAELIQYIIDVIDDGNLDNLVDIEYPSVVWATSALQNAYAAIFAQRVNFGTDITNYILETYPNFTYDRVKCKRDVDLILDAVSRDIKLGTNHNAIVAGQAYRRGTASVVDAKQLPATLMALRYLKSLVVSDVAASSTAVTRATDSFDALLQMVEYGTIVSEGMTFPSPNNASQERIDAARQLQDNRDFLIAEVIAWINDNYFIYDAAKCARDTNLILDAVGWDITLGTNYFSVTSGLAYYNANASVVVGDQLVETAGAITHLKSLVAVLIAAYSAAGTRSNAAFDEILDILQNGTGNADALTWTDPGVDSNKLYARQQLQANRTFIIAEITAWIAANFPTLVYDVSKCERDVGYIVDALSTDIQYGGNVATKQAAKLYFEGTSSVLPAGELTATIEAFKRLEDLVGDIVIEAPVVKTPANAQTQDTSGTAASSTEADEVSGLMSIIVDALIAGDIDDLPADQEYDLSWVSSVYTDARNLIVSSGDSTGADLVQEVITYINENYNGLSYNETKCGRDVGYVVDAITHDLLYGGNRSILIATRAYFDDGITVIMDQETETSAAYEHLRDVSSLIIEGTLVTPTTGNSESQVLTPGFGSAIESSQAEDLYNILIDALSSSLGLETTPSNANPDFSWVSAPVQEAANLLVTNSANYQQNVIDYITNNIIGFTYDQDKCGRDTGYIVDAAVYDMTYGGNKQTRRAGEAYYNGAILGAANVGTADQTEVTEFTYKYLAEILSNIAQNIEITKSDGNTATQTITETDGSSAAASYIFTMVEKISEVVREGNDALPDEVDHDYDTYADVLLNEKRRTILEDLDAIEEASISALNLEYGGVANLTLFPGVLSVVQGTRGNMQNVSTVSTSGHAFEYVGAGITYNALPFFGGSPISENEFIESNQGKVFAGGTVDQIGNFKVGNFFNVNALTGAITLNANQINLSGISSIGPFQREGIPVGVELKEVSNNTNLVASTGSADINTVPTQFAVVEYVENRYLNKLTGGTVEGDTTFDTNIAVDGGEISTISTTFDLIADNANVVNFATGATDITIGATIGTTTIRTDVVIEGSTDITGDVTIVGDVSITIPDEIEQAFSISEGTEDYFSVNTQESAEKITFGPQPKVEIQNTTQADSGTINTGALVVDGGLGVAKNVSIGGDLYFEGTIISTSSGSLSLFNNAAGTVDAFGAATQINLGSSGIVPGNFVVNNDYIRFTSVYNMKIPTGETGQRGDTPEQGYIRFNTTLGIFEGYDGIAWNTLGGVRDVDGNTFISPESAPGANENTLSFVTDGLERMALSTTNLRLDDTITSVSIEGVTESTAWSNGQITVVGGVGIGGKLNVRGDIRGYNNALFEGNLTATGSVTFGTLDSIVDAFEVNANSVFNVWDNTVQAFEVLEGANSYFKLTTSDGNELATFDVPRVLINNTTNSTNSSTGALVIAGGVGIGGSLYVDGGFTVGGSIAFGDDPSADTFTVQGATDFTIPDNSATAFVIDEGTTNYLTIDTSNGSELITVGTVPQVYIANTTDSSDKDTGALVVDGGVGIELNTYIGVDLFVGRNTVLTGDLAVNGGDLTTTATTFNLLNANATTINIGADATTINIGADTGTLTISNEITIFDSVTSIQIPVGNTGQRPSEATGQIRFNTDTSVFEGYDGVAWGSLGGVKDVDQNTFIRPETSPGANNDELEFFTAGVRRAIISNTAFNIEATNVVSILNDTPSVTVDDGALVVTGGVGIGRELHVNEYVGGNTDGVLQLTRYANDKIVIRANTIESYDETKWIANAPDSSTDSIVYPIILAHHNVSGVVVPGFGTGIKFEMETSNDNFETGGQIDVVSTDVTGTQEDFDMVFSTMINGTAGIEKLRLSETTSTFSTNLQINQNLTVAGIIDAAAITASIYADDSTEMLDAISNRLTVVTGQVGELTLTTDLEVQYGGTGTSTFTTDGILYGNAAGPVQVTDAAGTSDTSESFQILTVVGGGDNTPVWTDTIDGGTF